VNQQHGDVRRGHALDARRLAHRGRSELLKPKPRLGAHAVNVRVADRRRDARLLHLARPGDLRALLLGLGFSERVRGSHHLFHRDGVVEIVNIQSRGGQAKPYQVRQVRNVILKYRLGGAD